MPAVARGKAQPGRPDSTPENGDHGGRKRLREVIRLVQPETVRKWQRELVRRKWTYDQHTKPRGNVPLDAGCSNLDLGPIIDQHV